MHNVFILMSISGSTPKACKESRTVLLCKKGDEYELNNWRPVALANTTYTPWTGMIAKCVGKYADYYNIVSDPLICWMNYPIWGQSDCELHVCTTLDMGHHKSAQLDAQIVVL